MADLFWAYWDATVRFALLALILLLITPLLKRMISPRLLCWAWALLILRLALPFSLPFSGSIFNVHESLQPSTWTEAIRKGVVESGWGETLLPPLRDEDNIIIARIPVSWETALMGLWLFGVVAMAAHLLKNVAQLKRFFSRAERIASGPLHALFKDTRKRIGIYANVPLLVSNDIKTPGIAGVFNPRIIIPSRCAENLSDRELQGIFMHELTHYRRGDLFLHHALLLLCYIHWYNPIVWLVLKQFKEEMEKACDLEVVESVCAGTAIEYGHTLLHVLHLSRGAHFSPGGALSLLGNRKKGALKERITLIANRRKSNPLLAGLGLTVFGSSFLFAMTGELEPESEAMRLARLTRFSGPFEVGDAYEFEHRINVGTGAEDFSLSEDRREWVQIFDATRYAGRRVLVRASVRYDADIASVDLWASADDVKDRILDTVTMPFDRETNAQEATLILEIPKKAAKFRYGLSYHGSGISWVDQLEFEVLEDVE